MIPSPLAVSFWIFDAMAWGAAGAWQKSEFLARRRRRRTRAPTLTLRDQREIAELAARDIDYDTIEP